MSDEQLLRTVILNALHAVALIGTRCGGVKHAPDADELQEVERVRGVSQRVTVTDRYTE